MQWGQSDERFDLIPKLFPQKFLKIATLLISKSNLLPGGLLGYLTIQWMHEIIRKYQCTHKSA